MLGVYKTLSSQNISLTFVSPNQRNLSIVIIVIFAVTLIIKPFKNIKQDDHCKQHKLDINYSIKDHYIIV